MTLGPTDHQQSLGKFKFSNLHSNDAPWSLVCMGQHDKGKIKELVIQILALLPPRKGFPPTKGR